MPQSLMGSTIIITLPILVSKLVREQTFLNTHKGHAT